MVARILVGIDGSEGSRRALLWAAEEAAAHRASVEAVLVWRKYTGGLAHYPASDLEEQARVRLTKIVKEFTSEHPGVKIEPVVVEGDAAAILCERASGVDLLVVGSRGLGTFGRLLIGSVANKCAHHSPCPVVIVRRAPDS